MNTDLFRRTFFALVILLVHFASPGSMVAQPQTHSQEDSTLVNPSFESNDFSGYTSLDELSPDGGIPPPPPINDVTNVLGPESMTSEAGALGANDGNYFAVLHTVRESYRLPQSVVIQKSFTIPPNSTRLQVDLNFLTNETDTGESANDTAWVSLTIENTGQVIPVAFFSRNQLQANSVGQADAVRRVGGFKSSTGWQAREVDLSKYVGQSAFLTFNVRKARRHLDATSQDTALAVDAIRLIK